MLYRLLNFVVEWLSAEWVLTRCKAPNGGSVIVFRALNVALIVHLPVLVARVCVPHSAAPGWAAFGAVFAGAYASLQSRYASQWTYLANVYNRIKETAARGGSIDQDAMAEWKAGFIEDAEDLHLVGKPMFRSVFRAWAEDPHVEAAFCKYTERGQPRWAELKQRFGAEPGAG